MKDLENELPDETDLINQIASGYKKREEERTERLNKTIKEAEKVNLSELVDEGSDIATVRKENVFKSEVTVEEKEIIKQRVEWQRRNFLEFEKREQKKKVAKVQMIHPHVSDDEVVAALKENNNSEEEVVVFLTDCFNLHAVRQKLAKAAGNALHPTISIQRNEEESEGEEDIEDDEKPKKKKKSGGKKEYFLSILEFGLMTARRF